ncbi:hypothetical protein ACH5RR_016628 [Cinchona calisaya]|uniref:ACT domain-containing protein ACR n=1 Tax=Cinchona calisaya TaxID=153742 RepID=A0ABD2ZWJ2_9GENT
MRSWSDIVVLSVSYAMLYIRSVHNILHLTRLVVIILNADFSTDGKWCYIVLWVVPRPSSLTIDWESLKNWLLPVCPSCLISFYSNQQSTASPPPQVYLLKDFSSLSLEVAEDLFSCKLSNKEACSQAVTSNLTKARKATITVDNVISPAHTLLQIQCTDQKGLIYDILRTSKDLDIQKNVFLAYFIGNVAIPIVVPFSSRLFIFLAYFIGNVAIPIVVPFHLDCLWKDFTQGYRNMDLFIQKRGGKKIVDHENQVALCSRLKEEMLHPLRVTITSRGPDTELLAEIDRHSTSDRQWEVYRFLLEESRDFPLASRQA